MAEIDGSTLDRLYAVIASRRGGDPATSYTAKLFAAGPVKIAQKLGEEAVETVIEGARGNAAGVVARNADPPYHPPLLWAGTRHPPAQISRAPRNRPRTSRNDPKKSRPAGWR